MSEREKFEEYMLCGIKEKNTLKECIENELLILFFSALSIVIGAKHIALWALDILPLIFYPIFIIKYKKGRAIEGPLYLLHNGVFSGCISFVLEVMSIAIVFDLFHGKTRNIVVCIIIAGYISAILLYIHIFKKIINEKDYKKAKRSKVGLASSLGGVFGISVARTLNNIDSRKVLELLCILCFFASCLTLIGIFNIFKFQYLDKQNKKA